MIEQNDLVVLDFTGVNVVSNSFADECIAKLLLHFFISLSYFVYHMFGSLQILLLICWKMNLLSLQRRKPVERQSSNIYMVDQMKK